MTQDDNGGLRFSDRRAKFIQARLADNGFDVPEDEVWHALSNWEALNNRDPEGGTFECAARLGELWCCRKRGHHGSHRDGVATWEPLGFEARPRV